MPHIKKSPWSSEEDDALSRMVHIHGPKRWATIALSLDGRTGKQCRERWLNHLDPSVRKEAFTQEEDDLIVELVNTLGTKWAQISKHLPGRTDNAVKNRFYSTLRRVHCKKSEHRPLPSRKKKTLKATLTSAQSLAPSSPHTHEVKRLGTCVKLEEEDCDLQDKRRRQKPYLSRDGWHDKRHARVEMTRRSEQRGGSQKYSHHNHSHSHSHGEDSSIDGHTRHGVTMPMFDEMSARLLQKHNPTDGISGDTYPSWSMGMRGYPYLGGGGAKGLWEYQTRAIPDDAYSDSLQDEAFVKAVDGGETKGPLLNPIVPSLMQLGNDTDYIREFGDHTGGDSTDVNMDDREEFDLSMSQQTVDLLGSHSTPSNEMLAARHRVWPSAPTKASIATTTSNPHMFSLSPRSAESRRGESPMSMFQRSRGPMQSILGASSDRPTIRRPSSGSGNEHDFEEVVGGDDDDDQQLRDAVMYPQEEEHHFRHIDAHQPSPENAGMANGNDDDNNNDGIHGGHAYESTGKGERSRRMDITNGVSNGTITSASLMPGVEGGHLSRDFQHERTAHTKARETTKARRLEMNDSMEFDLPVPDERKDLLGEDRGDDRRHKLAGGAVMANGAAKKWKHDATDERLEVKRDGEKNTSGGDRWRVERRADVAKASMSSLSGSPHTERRERRQLISVMTRNLKQRGRSRTVVPKTKKRTVSSRSHRENDLVRTPSSDNSSDGVSNSSEASDTIHHGDSDSLTSPSTSPASPMGQDFDIPIDVKMKELDVTTLNSTPLPPLPLCVEYHYICDLINRADRDDGTQLPSALLHEI